MTLCHIDVRPRGFLCSYILCFCQLVWLSLLYRAASFIVFVNSTFTLPAFCQILLQKSIGVIPWLTYFLHCPNSQMPNVIVSFMKSFFFFFLNMLYLKIQRQKLLTVADFWFVNAIFMVRVSLNWAFRHLYAVSDCSLSQLLGLLPPPRAYVFSTQEIVNCNKSWRGQTSGNEWLGFWQIAFWRLIASRGSEV